MDWFDRGPSHIYFPEIPVKMKKKYLLCDIAQFQWNSTELKLGDITWNVGGSVEEALSGSCAVPGSIPSKHKTPDFNDSIVYGVCYISGYYTGRKFHCFVFILI